DVADELGRRPERDDDRLGVVAERGLDALLLALDVGELRGDRAQVALDAGCLVPVLAEPERRDETRFTASAERTVHRPLLRRAGPAAGGPRRRAAGPTPPRRCERAGSRRTRAPGCATCRRGGTRAA